MGGSSSYLDHADAIGTTTMETNQTGAVGWDTTYYPWGNAWQQTGGRPSGVFANLEWQVNDPLMPSATREYNPAVDHWLSPDRLAGNIMNPQSLNRYAYVLNNPVSNIDPSGLSCVHTDDGTTVDNLDGKGCSEMNNNPQQVNVSGDGPGSVDTSSLDHLGSLSSSGGANGGAGGGGGSVPAGGPVPSYGQVLKSFNNCAADFADKYSLASLLHLNDSLLGNTLFGSTTAAVSNLLFQSNPKVYVPAGASLAAGTRAGAAIKMGAAFAGKVPTGGTVYAYTGATVATPYGPALEMGRTGETLADTAVGRTALSGAKGAAGLLELAAPALIGYDEILYGIGEGVCTARAF